jgi:transcriptional regulator with XRE-family HTH domain
MSEAQQSSSEPSDFRARLGARLRHARKLVGLRQSDVAEALTPRVHIARISEWERGYAAPSVEQLAQLARLLDLSLDSLLLNHAEQRRCWCRRDEPDVAPW